MGAEIRIGCSGYSYNHWIGRYYPQELKSSQWLRHYAEDFDSVELNNTFYQLPKEEAFDNWRASTAPDFRFAVKGSRFITHMIKLKDPERGLVNFMPRAERLKKKLGPILWQLPPGWKVNLERLEIFLRMLPRRHRYTFEFRHESWITGNVMDLLRQYNAAFCIYELAGYQSPMEITANWTYVRLHGPTRFKYQGSYSDEQLAAWAKRIRAWSKELESIWVYFDNDDSAYAVENALTLKKMLRIPRPKATASRNSVQG